MGIIADRGYLKHSLIHRLEFGEIYAGTDVYYFDLTEDFLLALDNVEKETRKSLVDYYTTCQKTFTESFALLVEAVEESGLEPSKVSGNELNNGNDEKKNNNIENVKINNKTNKFLLIKFSCLFQIQPAALAAKCKICKRQISILHSITQNFHPVKEC